MRQMSVISGHSISTGVTPHPERVYGTCARMVQGSLENSLDLG